MPLAALRRADPSTPRNTRPADDAALRPRPRGAARRFGLAGCGVIFVGIGGVGVFLPGLPTTIFLIAASWCFVRSCPHLEERLLGAAIFRPYRGFVSGREPIPRRARVVATIAMWTAIAVSAVALDRPLAVALLLAAGALGTVCVWRIRRGAASHDASR